MDEGVVDEALAGYLHGLGHCAGAGYCADEERAGGFGGGAVFDGEGVCIGWWFCGLEVGLGSCGCDGSGLGWKV